MASHTLPPPRPCCCGCRFRNLEVVLEAFSASVDVLIMLFVLLVILLVVFGTVFYFVEGPPGTVASIPEAMYYVQVRPLVHLLHHTTLTCDAAATPGI